MNKIRGFWNKSSINKIIILFVGLFCLPCTSCFCITSIFPASPTAPVSSVPIETIVEETSNAAYTQTISASSPTPFPTFTEIPSSTPFLLPTLGPLPYNNLLATIPGASCAIKGTPQTGLVVDVVDGDTIKVKLDQDGGTYSVRYIGMDTPESTIQHEPFGKEASEKNAELVSGKKVTLFKDVSETDKYNRLLRYVFVDDIFVNYELVKQGFANSATYPPDVSCVDLFRETENRARSSLLGLWALQPLATATLQLSSSQSVTIVAVNKSAEYVDIKNTGSIPVDLNGWTLVSEKGNQRCGLGGTLAPGVTLRIWAGTASDGGFSCGFGKNIWNNSESDPAVLLDAQGREVDRH
jgi:micrococcal nuclease